MEVLKDVAYKIFNNRVKIFDSYKITTRTKMKEILYAICYNHPEITFNRTYDELTNEWVAHNRLYKGSIKRNHTKDVDLSYKESVINKIVGFILSI